MTSTPVRIIVVYSVPVPVGHRVRVRWYRLEKKRGRPLEKPYEPTVEDLDTGVLYTSDWLYAMPSTRQVGEAIDISAEPQPGIIAIQELVGRVVACRIITLRTPEYDAQTELTLAPEPQGYRG